MSDVCMSGAWSFAEIEGQRVELLPARAVLSLSLSGAGHSGGTDTGFNGLGSLLGSMLSQANSAGNGMGGPGGSGDAGAAGAKGS